MFFLLRKICIGIAILLVALGIYYLYLKREVFQPAVALVKIWQNENVDQQRITGTANGKVTRVLSGNMLWVKMVNGQQFPLRLTGIEVPPMPPKPEPELKDLIERSRDLLSSLTLSNEVVWQTTFANNQTNVSGIVHVGTNNVNLLMLESGLAKLHMPAIAGLPFKEQYRFFQAQYGAKKNSKGWWGSPFENYF